MKHDDRDFWISVEQQIFELIIKKLLENMQVLL